MTTVVSLINVPQKQVGNDAVLASTLGEVGDHQPVRNVPVVLQCCQRRLESGLARLLQTPVTCEPSDEDAGSCVGGSELHHGFQVSLTDGLACSRKCGDPSFAAPIYANLFDDEDGEGSSLIWSRPNTRRGD